jgi:hypothetical protein
MIGGATRDGEQGLSRTAWTKKPSQDSRNRRGLSPGSPAIGRDLILLALVFVLVQKPLNAKVRAGHRLGETEMPTTQHCPIDGGGQG